MQQCLTLDHPNGLTCCPTSSTRERKTFWLFLPKTLAAKETFFSFFIAAMLPKMAQLYFLCLIFAAVVSLTLSLSHTLSFSHSFSISHSLTLSFSHSPFTHTLSTQHLPFLLLVDMMQRPHTPSLWNRAGITFFSASISAIYRLFMALERMQQSQTYRFFNCQRVFYFGFYSFRKPW